MLIPGAEVSGLELEADGTTGTGMEPQRCCYNASMSKQRVHLQPPSFSPPPAPLLIFFSNDDDGRSPGRSSCPCPAAAPPPSSSSPCPPPSSPWAKPARRRPAAAPPPKRLLSLSATVDGRDGYGCGACCLSGPERLRVRGMLPLRARDGRDGRGGGRLVVVVGEEREFPFFSWRESLPASQMPDSEHRSSLVRVPESKMTLILGQRE